MNLTGKGFRSDEFYGTPLSRRNARDLKGILDRCGLLLEEHAFPALLPVPEPHLGSLFPVYSLKPAEPAGRAEAPVPEISGPCIVIGMMRMGYGHYRTGLALASAAAANGVTPLLFDPGWVSEEIYRNLGRLDAWYRKGSQLAHRSSLFNSLVWERGTGKTFKKIDAMVRVYRAAEQLLPAFLPLDEQWPFVGTHSWLSQAASLRGMTRVANAVQDNWPQGFFLSGRGIQCVQGPSSYSGYRLTLGMGGRRKEAEPIPGADLLLAGHFVDSLVLGNLQADCTARTDRSGNKEPRRFLLSLGGAGAQEDLAVFILRQLLPYVKKGRAVIALNCGEHGETWRRIRFALTRHDSGAEKLLRVHSDWEETLSLFRDAPPDDFEGIHVWVHDSLMPAVFTTNLLIRWCDFLVTKPGELAFYPVPKINIKRLGAHEAWSAIRSAELGDGTPELSSPARIKKTLAAVTEQDDILRMMTSCIVNNYNSGIYNGAENIIRRLLKT